MANPSADATGSMDQIMQLHRFQATDTLDGLTYPVVIKILVRSVVIRFRLLPSQDELLGRSKLNSIGRGMRDNMLLTAWNEDGRLPTIQAQSRTISLLANMFTQIKSKTRDDPIRSNPLSLLPPRRSKSRARREAQARSTRSQDEDDDDEGDEDEEESHKRRTEEKPMQGIHGVEKQNKPNSPVTQKRRRDSSPNFEPDRSKKVKNSKFAPALPSVEESTTQSRRSFSLIMRNIQLNKVDEFGIGYAMVDKQKTLFTDPEGPYQSLRQNVLVRAIRKLGAEEVDRDSRLLYAETTQGDPIRLEDDIDVRGWLTEFSANETRYIRLDKHYVSPYTAVGTGASDHSPPRRTLPALRHSIPNPSSATGPARPLFDDEPESSPDP